MLIIHHCNAIPGLCALRSGVKVRKLVKTFTYDPHDEWMFSVYICMFSFYVKLEINDVQGLFQGDGNIRYYEVTTEKPYMQYLMEFRSPAPQKGLGEFRIWGSK